MSNEERSSHEDNKPLYFGNLSRRATEKDVERALEDKGFKVSKIDIKDGFAFVYLDGGDADAAVREFDGVDLEGRRLRVEKAKGEGRAKRREEERRANQTPNKTLFVVNFDPARTNRSDLKDVFGAHGAVASVEIKKKFRLCNF
eukprot:TRINITY_DN5146_c0_g1_i1.p1 TRINITY_DN5146_c0_g1~~TRINITY_DN5146_c0_g1_i1.p1  ORF type:complete len:144 (+),score=34.03 TRINITY_DN5146_c0_g1_i1:40-471(+)